MRTDTLRGQLGWLGPGTGEFLRPVKWHRADRRVLYGAQKTRLPLRLPPFPHPELIRNQQQTVRCIKGRFGT
jgi:hypothetical protein